MEKSQFSRKEFFNPMFYIFLIFIFRFQIYQHYSVLISVLIKPLGKVKHIYFLIVLITINYPKFKQTSLQMISKSGKLMVLSMLVPVFQATFGPKFGLCSLKKYSVTDWKETHILEYEKLSYIQVIKKEPVQRRNIPKLMFQRNIFFFY